MARHIVFLFQLASAVLVAFGPQLAVADALCYCSLGQQSSAISCRYCYCPPPSHVQSCRPHGAPSHTAMQGKPCDGSNNCNVIGGVCGSNSNNNWCQTGASVSVEGGVAVAKVPVTINLVGPNLGSVTDDENATRFRIQGSTSFSWGDNTPDSTSASNSSTHTFAKPGTYRVRVKTKADFKWNNKKANESCSYSCWDSAEADIHVVARNSPKFLAPPSPSPPPKGR